MRPTVLAVCGIGAHRPLHGQTCTTTEQIRFDIRAPRADVFVIITAGYAPRRPQALAEKFDVLERGSTARPRHSTHSTPHPVRYGLMAATTETVRFTRPDHVDFRLVRGPVPHVVESFILSETSIGTRLDYHGELGTDLWAIGEWWGRKVSTKWEAAVRKSHCDLEAEAER